MLEKENYIVDLIIGSLFISWFSVFSLYFPIAHWSRGSQQVNSQKLLLEIEPKNVHRSSKIVKLKLKVYIKPEKGNCIYKYSKNR